MSDSERLSRDTAEEIADEVVDAFSEMYPHMRMNRQEWATLHEMIIREVFGHFGTDKNGELLNMHATDLLPFSRKAGGSP